MNVKPLNPESQWQTCPKCKGRGCHVDKATGFAYRRCDTCIGGGQVRYASEVPNARR